MKIQKKVSIGGDWAKVRDDITNEGSVTIKDGGVIVPGEFGDRHVFKILTKNGEKVFSMNQTSLNNLVDAYGDDSDSWIGKTARTYVIKQKVGDKLRDVAYLCGIDYHMNDEGYFIKGNPTKELPTVQLDDEVSVEDIPF